MKKILLPLAAILFAATPAQADPIEDLDLVIAFCEKARVEIVKGNDEVVTTFMKENFTEQERKMVATICYAYAKGYQNATV